MGNTTSVMATTESQPSTVGRVAFWVPAPVKTTPFQVWGSSLAQMVLVSVTEYVGFTSSVMATTESQPWTVWRVALRVPAPVKVTPFQV